MTSDDEKALRAMIAQRIAGQGRAADPDELDGAVAEALLLSRHMRQFRESVSVADAPDAFASAMRSGRRR